MRVFFSKPPQKNGNPTDREEWGRVSYFEERRNPLKAKKKEFYVEGLFY